MYFHWREPQKRGGGDEGLGEAENKEEPGETPRQSCVQEERRVQAKAED